MPLDRLVDLVVPVAPGANGGLTGTIDEFRLVHERGFQQSVSIGVIDTYIVAWANGAPAAGAISGTWLANSVIRWENQLAGPQHATFNRPAVWTGNTYSLRFGGAWVANRGLSATGQIRNPWITTPDWLALLATYATPETAGTVLDVSGVLPQTTESARREWASLLDESSILDDSPAGADEAPVTRVVESATYRMRWDGRLVPFSTLTDGRKDWQVVATRRNGARGRFMEVDVSREFYGTGR